MLATEQLNSARSRSRFVHSMKKMAPKIRGVIMASFCTFCIFYVIAFGIIRRRANMRTEAHVYKGRPPNAKSISIRAASVDSTLEHVVPVVRVMGGDQSDTDTKDTKEPSQGLELVKSSDSSFPPSSSSSADSSSSSSLQSSSSTSSEEKASSPSSAESSPSSVSQMSSSPATGAGAVQPAPGNSASSASGVSNEKEKDAIPAAEKKDEQTASSLKTDESPKTQAEGDKVVAARELFNREMARREETLDSIFKTVDTLKLDEKNASNIWNAYDPVYHCPDEGLVGTVSICHLKELRAPCVIYSQGHGDYSFENALLASTPCEVHTFQWTDAEKKPTAADARLHLHTWTLAKSDGQQIEKPPMHDKFFPTHKTLKTSMKELGHTKIDLLVLDIEWAEYDLLKNALEDGLGPAVAQLHVEVHLLYNNFTLLRHLINALTRNNFHLYTKTRVAEAGAAQCCYHMGFIQFDAARELGIELPPALTSKPARMRIRL